MANRINGQLNPTQSRKRLKRHVELPTDVLYDILLRLPVRTLSRLRCVSKPWCSLISHPRFQKEYNHRAKQSPLLLLMTRDANYNLAGFTTYANDGSLLREFSMESSCRLKFHFVQSCLGLVCIRLCGPTDVGSILVCNPSTEEKIILPKQPKYQFHICLGFGYAASTEEFKLVKFFTIDDSLDEDSLDEETCYCEVFTLGSYLGWRESRSPPPYMPLDEAHIPFLNGALHLLPDEYSQPQDDKYIAAFDVDTEEYTMIMLPEIFANRAMESEFLHLAGLRETLCLTFDFSETKKMIELWFLVDYHGGRWVKQYNIDLSAAVFFIWAYPLELKNDGSILLNVHSREKTRYFYYNTRDGCVKETKGTNCAVTFYIESFLPLRSR